MKKKLLILTIAIIIAPLFLNTYKVEANNEIDTENLIGNSSITENENEKSESVEQNETITNETVQNDNNVIADDTRLKTTASDNITTEEDWTDFSNAKFELKKDRETGAKVEVSGVNIKDAPIGSIRYYLLITSNSSKPDITSDWKEKAIELHRLEDDNILTTNDFQKVAYYVELNQDLYASIIEKNFINGDEIKNVRSYGNKLTRFSEPKFSDAFHATHLTNDSDQIVTNFTHNKENNRKFQIKIGRITDISILQKIKDKNTTGFEELLNYAKSIDGIYNQILDADKDNYFYIGYSAGIFDSKKVNSLIQINGLVDKEYYFLYIKTDDENGKYISNDAITLAQAKVSDYGWGLFFYGSNDFKWTEWNTPTENTNTLVNTDPSVVPTSLPYTGVKYVLYGAAIFTITAVGIFAYKKYKYFNF